MKRRQFLKNVVPASLAIPSFINGFSIKAMGAVNPLMQSLLLPTTETDHVLVLVQLTGGNDGLNTIIPLDRFSSYVNARQNIYLPQDKVLPLYGSDKVGIHPAMMGMQKMSMDGILKVINAVGYPQPNFSHFRATDIWMSASDSTQVLNTGWAGRYLNYEYPNFPNGYPNSSMTDPLAIQIGSVTSLALQGPQVSLGMSISNPNSFYSLLNGVQDPVPNTPAGKELAYVRQIAQQTQQYAAVVKNAATAVPTQVTYPTNNSLADQLKIVARLIKGGLKTRIYMVSYGSFDTHSAQVNSIDTTTGTHANLLKNVSDAIKAFQDDLKFLGVDDRVVGMTFSEFGRRIKSNASTGTDHGTAAPMFVFGKNVLGGVLGNSPEIPANAGVNDNIPFQYDFRSVYATLLSNWLCVDSLALNQIMLKNYQTLPLVNTAACRLSNPNTSGNLLIINSPNPFTTSTQITFHTDGGHTLIQIMDTSGRVIATPLDKEYPGPGTYSLTFNASYLQSGVYYARLQNMATQQVRTMLKVQ
jgi:uncharacterized protein (DUF1501 family)